MLTHDTLLEVITALPGNGYRDLPGLDQDCITVLDMMSDRNPELLQLVARLATTGSAIARNNASGNFCNEVNIIIKEADISSDGETTKPSAWDLAYSSVINAYAESQLGQMALAWNFNNVAFESGETNPLAYEVLMFSAMQRLKPYLRQKRTDSFWRGVSALYLSLNKPIPTFYPMAHTDFIEWASTYPDLGSLVRLARERVTLSVPTLKSLLVEQSNKSTLKSGVL